MRGCRRAEQAFLSTRVPDTLDLALPQLATTPTPDRQKEQEGLLRSLNRKHVEYERGIERWRLLKAVVAGGDKVDATIKKKLLANPDSRPDAVVAERVKVASYVNKIAPILARFNAQLFEKDATYDGSKDSFWQDEFFDRGGRVPGDDDNRAAFFTFLREAMFEALTTRKAIAQIDTAVSSEPGSRANQRQSGEDKPYVVLRGQDSLWDWTSGQDGFQYAKLHDFSIEKPDWKTAPYGQHKFTIYERDGERVLVSVYTVRKKAIPGRPPDATEFKLDGLKPDDVEIAFGKSPSGAALDRVEVFNVGGNFKFPIVTLTLPSTLCLADQLFDCQVSYFNTTSGIQWKLQSLNYAMPVLTGGDLEDGEDPLNGQKWGDGFYLRLPQNYSLGSLELGGSGVSTAMEWRTSIAQDIKDVLYQIAMSAADGAAVVARSAASKREDRRPEQVLLETYGQLVREFAKQILDCAALARGEVVDWTVTGFNNFLGEGLAEAVEDFTGLQALPMPSLTFKKVVAKAVAQQFAQSYDTDETIVDTINEEIDQADEAAFAPPAPPGAPPAPPGAPPAPPVPLTGESTDVPG